MSRTLFLNLAVKDLDASVAFFSELGFTFNPQFTNENATAMIINDQAVIMLLVEPFFATFTDRPLADPNAATEALVCVSADSREEVDQLVQKALAAGGKPARDPIDYGFMYGWSFYDIDGHHWEVNWMEPATADSGPPSVEG